MSLTIEISPHSSSEPLHFVPIRLEKFAGGTAAVQTYFTPKPTTTTTPTDPILEASLRGRKLVGRSVPLPDHCLAAILETQRHTDGASEKPVVKVATSSLSIIHYNHDTTPTATDPIPKALDWIKFARKMHAPVSADAVLAKQQQQQ